MVICIIYFVFIIGLIWYSILNKKRIKHGGSKKNLEEYQKKKTGAIVLAGLFLVSVIIASIILWLNAEENIIILDGQAVAETIESDPGNPDFDKMVRERTERTVISEGTEVLEVEIMTENTLLGESIQDIEGLEGAKEEEEVSIEVIESISNQYNILYMFGTYDFEDGLGMSDINNISNLITNYKKNKEYLWMEEELPFSEIQNRQQRIEEFDITKQNNLEQLRADEYSENSYDRFACYKENGEIEMLEQAAISAEGAVEVRQIESIPDYSKLFSDIKNTVVLFIHVEQEGNEPYYSGTTADVNYRIGKVLYKPVANLKKANDEEKKYSLCCAYCFLYDAYTYSTPDNLYAIEIAYYYLRVCEELAGYMRDDEDISIMYKEVEYAYKCFMNRGENNPYNQTYIKYKDAAEQIYVKAEKWLGENDVTITADVIMEETK